MTSAKKIISVGLIIATLFSLMATLTIGASAASLGTRYSCIGYNYMGKNAGKSTYKTQNFTVDNNDRVTIQCYWNTENLKNQTSVGLNGKKVKDYLRFDVHVIDKKTGQVVNYWYGLKPGATFKVYSAVPSIKRSTYTVRVTSYLSNYKTYTNSNLAGVATCLNYRLK